ncbi:DUF6907 domain-containing protein [Amycolatopsis pigmentata]|uniref:DUF6907 domain-containing protein n=1 Tax=Amycolatopsis pigmentata TaxID=450801 RepID=A0ABW5G4J8_9PSEU
MQECMPFWQTTPCPPWCTIGHRDADFPEDRLHRPEIKLATVKLTTSNPIRCRRADGEWYFESPEINIDLEQHVRETTPRILLSEVNSPGYSLTPTEAVEIGRALIAAGKLADETA